MDNLEGAAVLSSIYRSRNLGSKDAVALAGTRRNLLLSFCRNLKKIEGTLAAGSAEAAGAVGYLNSVVYSTLLDIDNSP